MAKRIARSTQHIETELSRDLGLPSALAIGVGTMIAAGIFTLSGLAVRNVGSAAIAKDKERELLLLRVLAIPDQLSPIQFDADELEKEKEVLRRAENITEALGIPAHGIVRVGHNVARAILETSTEHHCDLIVLGWKGHSRSGERILGNIIDATVRYADADLMLVKFAGNGPIKNILLPTAGGEHARWAEQYCTHIVQAAHGSVTVCRVVPENEKAAELPRHEQMLEAAVDRLGEQNGFEVNRKIIRNDSVAEGVISAAGDYDAVMVGATRDSIYPQILFGSIPERIAKGTDKTVIMVKHHDPVKALLGKVIAE